MLKEKQKERENEIKANVDSDIVVAKTTFN
jgi:hypothetical protein